LKAIRYIGACIGVIWVLLLFKQWILIYIKFRDYLFDKNDIETLLLMGGIHNGKKVIGSMATIKAHKRLIAKYEQTGDECYYLFDKYMIRHFKFFYLSALMTFVFYIITLIIEELFF
jgi:hypothetical protein